MTDEQFIELWNGAKSIQVRQIVNQYEEMTNDKLPPAIHKKLS